MDLRQPRSAIMYAIIASPKGFGRSRDDREMKGKCLHMHAKKGSHEQDNEPMQIMLAGV